MSLFETWLKLERQEKSMKDALKDINEACDKKYQHNWATLVRKRGTREVAFDLNVREYMMRRVLQDEFPDYSEEKIESLIKKLT